MLGVKITQKGILRNKRGDLVIDRRAFGLHVGIGIEILSFEDLQLIGELDSGILPGSTPICLEHRWSHRPRRGRGPGSRRLHGSHSCFVDPNPKISTKSPQERRKSKSRSPLSTSSSSKSNPIQSPKKKIGSPMVTSRMEPIGRSKSRLRRQTNEVKKVETERRPAATLLAHPETACLPDGDRWAYRLEPSERKDERRRRFRRFFSHILDVWLIHIFNL